MSIVLFHQSSSTDTTSLDTTTIKGTRVASYDQEGSSGDRNTEEGVGSKSKLGYAGNLGTVRPYVNTAAACVFV